MNDVPPNFGGLLEPPPSEDPNFLDHYFASVYNKLEADALLFNRKLPHSGLVGSENENAIASVIRDFLPGQFGVEVNAIVIDRFGHASRQADIVIYDAHRQPSFFRKVYPVEIMYAVIEVKTSMSSTEAESALNNLASVAELEFHPALTPYWQTRTQKDQIYYGPPSLYVFAYRTNCESFETFARWFDWKSLSPGVQLAKKAPTCPEIGTLTICALDQGLIQMESPNGHAKRWLAHTKDDSASRTFWTTLLGHRMAVDPAKSLFLFMQHLWFGLETHDLHPGFDIRSYMSAVLGTVVPVSDEHIYPRPST